MREESDYMHPFGYVMDKAREKGGLDYFECDTDIPPPVYDDDDERMRYLKERCAAMGHLWMERYLLADQMKEIWTIQGWTVYIAQFTHVGYLGPRFIKRMKKILETLDIGEWTMQPVEMSWAVVFATKNPEDIKVFEGL